MVFCLLDINILLLYAENMAGSELIKSDVNVVDARRAFDTSERTIKPDLLRNQTANEIILTINLSKVPKKDRDRYREGVKLRVETAQIYLQMMDLLDLPPKTQLHLISQRILEVRHDAQTLGRTNSQSAPILEVAQPVAELRTVLPDAGIEVPEFGKIDTIIPAIDALRPAVNGVGEPVIVVVNRVKVIRDEASLLGRSTARSGDLSTEKTYVNDFRARADKNMIPGATGLTPVSMESVLREIDRAAKIAGANPNLTTYEAKLSVIEQSRGFAGTIVHLPHPERMTMEEIDHQVRDIARLVSDPDHPAPDSNTSLNNVYIYIQNFTNEAEQALYPTDNIEVLVKQIREDDADQFPQDLVKETVQGRGQVVNLRKTIRAISDLRSTCVRGHVEGARDGRIRAGGLRANLENDLRIAGEKIKPTLLENAERLAKLRERIPGAHLNPNPTMDQVMVQAQSSAFLMNMTDPYHQPLEAILVRAESAVSRAAIAQIDRASDPNEPLDKINLNLGIFEAAVQRALPRINEPDMGKTVARLAVDASLAEIQGADTMNPSQRAAALIIFREAANTAGITGALDQEMSILMRNIYTRAEEIGIQDARSQKLNDLVTQISTHVSTEKKAGVISYTTTREVVGGTTTEETARLAKELRDKYQALGFKDWDTVPLDRAKAIVDNFKTQDEVDQFERDFQTALR